MRLFHIQLLALSLFLISFSASAHAESTALAVANNDFSFKLFNQLDDTNQNAFISPYSIYVALSLAYAGAQGNTKTEFERAMSNIDPESFHEAMARNMEDLNQRDGKGFSLYVANALWVDKQSKVLSSYQDFLEKYYNTSEHSFDKLDPEESAEQVNDWVSEKTKDRITDLVTPENMQASNLVLTNAIYFKGDWWMPFEKEATDEGDFKLFFSQPVKVKMMHQKSHFNYQVIDSVKFIEMPYKDSQLSMILVLPEKEGKEALNLAAKNLVANFKKFDSTKPTNPEVMLSLPKFKIEPTGLILNSQLKKLGIEDAFEFSRADFSGITGNKNLIIGLVAHKAMINVDEKGTEAAAATAIMMLDGAAFNANKPEEFKADRPFIYLIRDKKTGLVLFIGKLLNPIS